jgi:hypothetical protein
VPERKPLFKKTGAKSGKLFLKIFSAEEKATHFLVYHPLFVITWQSQIVGAPSLWITLRLLTKMRQAARFCCSSNSRSRSMSRLMVPSF